MEILQGIAPGSCQFDLFRRAIKQYKIGPYRPLRRHQSVTAQLTAQAARQFVAARGHKIGRLKLEDLPIVLAAVANRSQIRPGQERLRGHTRQAAACQLHHKRRAVIQNSRRCSGQRRQCNAQDRRRFYQSVERIIRIIARTVNCDRPGPRLRGCGDIWRMWQLIACDERQIQEQWEHRRNGRFGRQFQRFLCQARPLIEGFIDPHRLCQSLIPLLDLIDPVGGQTARLCQFDHIPGPQMPQGWRQGERRAVARHARLNQPALDNSPRLLFFQCDVEL